MFELKLFKSKMKQYKATTRSSTISNAFAAALAPADAFDEQELVKALKVLGQDSRTGLVCVYCDKEAQSIDHLHSLVDNKKFSGHGHVLGNLVPACKKCNESKGSKPWKTFAMSKGVSQERIDQIQKYSELAPEPTSEDELRVLYPDLMAAYERLKHQAQDLLKVADHLANEIHRLEAKRLKRKLG